MTHSPVIHLNTINNSNTNKMQTQFTLFTLTQLHTAQCTCSMFQSQEQREHEPYETSRKRIWNHRKHKKIVYSTNLKKNDLDNYSKRNIWKIHVLLSHGKYTVATIALAIMSRTPRLKVSYPLGVQVPQVKNHCTKWSIRRSHRMEVQVKVRSEVWYRNEMMQSQLKVDELRKMEGRRSRGEWEEGYR